MRTGMGEWLFTVLTVSLVCALAEGLMPRGPVQKAGRLVCGLALLCSVLGPLAGADGDRLRDFAVDWEPESLTGEELEARLEPGLRAVIEERCGAYILDKAMQQGISCRAEIVCRRTEEKLWMPDAAVITGRLTLEERGTIARLLTEELGIPAQRQRYVTEEESP